VRSSAHAARARRLLADQLRNYGTGGLAEPTFKHELRALARDGIHGKRGGELGQAPRGPRQLCVLGGS
jgi:hypothetical protein|tara:strand:+ start:109 stop:312 length:204 start_codon:yes stop_codon:yes gene_type:complete